MVETRKNIFLLDDDEAAHVYHKISIVEAGIDPSGVKSFFGVDEAIEYLAQIYDNKELEKWPDYIFIDLNMPIKSGYDFIETFEANYLDFPVPNLYLVSSTKNPFDIEKARKMPILKGFESKFLEKEFFESLLN